MDRPPPSYAEIAALLRAAARRAAALRAVATLGIALGLAGLILAAAAAILPTHPSTTVRLLALVLAPGLALLAPLVALWWPLQGAAAVARRALWPDPSLKSEIRSAIELSAPEEYDRALGASTGLIAAHAHSTALRAQGVEPGSLLPSRSSWLILAGGLALVTLVAAAGRGPLRAGFLMLRHFDAPVAAAAPRDPITGDVELTYLYPSHTHLPSRTTAGTNGEVNAPVGTLVQLKTRADRAVASAALVINGKANPLSVAADRELSGSFVVREAGAYLFRLKNARGEVLAEGPPISIALQADAPPQVRIDKPSPDLEVAPEALVPIEYRVSDDYGVSEVALVYRMPASPKDTRILLRKDPGTPLRAEGSANLDLAPLHLSAGDRLSYTIEALDNDQVSGPKTGQAPSQTLRIFSAAEHHREGLHQARALWEKLITLLADRLDEHTKLQSASAILASNEGEPGPFGGFGEPAASDIQAFMLCDEMSETSRKLRKDPAAPKELALALGHVARRERERASSTSSVRQGIARAVKNRPGFARASALTLGSVLEDEIAGLEGDTLYLEALLDRQTLDDLVGMAKEMSSRRRDLANLVEKYRKTPSPELRAAINAQVARMRERVQELLARMSELARGLSNEHMNQEALAQLSKNKDLGDGLNQIEKAMAEGDPDAALKSLDELASSLESTIEALKKQQGQAGNSFPELAGKLRELGQDLKDLTEKERALGEETERVRDHYRDEMKTRPQPSAAELAKLREAAAKAGAHLEQVSEHVLYPGLLGAEALALAREKTQMLQQALEVKDLEQALHSVEQALHGAQEADASARADAQLNFSPSPNLPSPSEQIAAARQHLGASVPLLKGVRDALARMAPNPDRLLSPGDQKSLERLSQKQGEVRSKLGGLYKQMADLQRSAPLFDPSAERHLDKAGAEMGAAQESLSGHRPGEALGKERSALSELNQLGDSMKGQAGGSGAGMPMPFAMSEPSGGEESGDDSEGLPGEREKVVIPGADQYRVPDRFRKDLLDAMRQKPPQTFEEQVKKYYQEIVR